MLDEEIYQGQSVDRVIESLHIQKSGSIDDDVMTKLDAIPEGNGSKRRHVKLIHQKSERFRNSSDPSEGILANNDEADGQDDLATNNLELIKKPDPVVIPEDFLCPISLELMRDPVIVATGQACFTSNAFPTHTRLE